MPDDLQARWDFLQHLGDVLAQLRQMRATAPRADIARRVDDLLTRQMLRQRPAHRLAPHCARAVGGRYLVYSAPLCGSRLSIVCTCAANVSKPLRMSVRPQAR